MKKETMRKRSVFENRILGSTGIAVSSVGFGVHPLGPSRRNLSIEEGAELMAEAYRRGIRFFDTAQFYGTYHYLKAALDLIQAAPYYDGLPVISTKSLAESFEEMEEAVLDAIDSTGLSTIDIFLMHQVTPGYREERSGAWEALKKAKREGRVRAIGISTHHEDVVSGAAEDPEIDCVFALYNVEGLGIRKGHEAGSAQGMLAAMEACRDAGKGVYSMKVFGGGNLTTDYQRAARHVLIECRDVITSAVIGFTDVQEITDLEELLAGTMPKTYNPSTSHKLLRIDREDCMGCGTCVRICASGAMHYSREDGLAEIDYSRCVSCHYCAIACPERAIVMW